MNLNDFESDRAYRIPCPELQAAERADLRLHHRTTAPRLPSGEGRAAVTAPAGASGAASRGGERRKRGGAGRPSGGRNAGADGRPQEAPPLPGRGARSPPPPPPLRTPGRRGARRRSAICEAHVPLREFRATEPHERRQRGAQRGVMSTPAPAPSRWAHRRRRRRRRGAAAASSSRARRLATTDDRGSDRSSATTNEQRTTLRPRQRRGRDPAASRRRARPPRQQPPSGRAQPVKIEIRPVRSLKTFSDEKASQNPGDVIARRSPRDRG